MGGGGAGQRKVVVATPIAESSITIPGVRVVVDSGYRRSPRLDPSTGLERLVTVRICAASAAQRAGRAGTCHTPTSLSLTHARKHARTQA